MTHAASVGRQSLFTDTHAVAVAFAAAVACALAAGDVRAATVGQFNAGHTWPSTWYAVNPLNDADDGLAEQVDVVGDTTDPAVQVYFDNTYVNFRIRVDAGSGISWNDTIMVLIDYDRNGSIDYGFAWDSKGGAPNYHGLEMMVPGTVGTTWNGTSMDDFDGSNGQKSLGDIGYNATSQEGLDGYVRTVDGVSTTNFGTTTYVDIAVKCSYLTSARNASNQTLSLNCNQSWSIQTATIQNATDHAKITTDVAGSQSPSSAISFPMGTNSVDFVSFGLGLQSGGHAVVEWETRNELGTLGFFLYREGPAGDFIRVNHSIVPALPHQRTGARYQLRDPQAEPGATYRYKIVEAAMGGDERIYGPFSVTVPASAAGPDTASPWEWDPRISYQRFAHEQQNTAHEHRNVGRSSRRCGRAPCADRPPRRGGQRAKVTIGESGLYFLSTNALAESLEIPTWQVGGWLRSGGLRISSQGRTIAYDVADDGSGLYFWGERLESLYSTENVYWMSFGRGDRFSQAQRHPRMPLRSSTEVSPVSYAESIHLEEDHWPIQGIALDPESDYWMWAFTIAGDPTLGRQSFVLAVPDPVRGPATLTAHLQGASDTGAPTDHHVRLLLNGTALGEARFDGVAPQDLTVSIPDGLLRPEINTVELEALLDPGVAFGVVYLDSFDIAYPRAYRAVNDAAMVRGRRNSVISVGGFTNPDIRVLELSDATHPREVRPLRVEPDGTAYRVRFVPISSTAPHVVVSGKGLRAPTRIESTPAFHLEAPTGGGAEYLVVTHASLAAAASDLAVERASRGVPVAVIDIEDIYDEFNFGIPSPHALKAFIRWAYERWPTPPRWVALAGDASVDYRDLLGHGENLVPTLMAPTPFGLASSDNALADVVGDDGVPELAIGRLPAHTEPQLRALVAKLAAHELQGGPDSPSRTLWLADDADSEGSYQADADRLSSLLPPTALPDRFYVGSAPLAELRSGMLQSLQAGPWFVNYLGHAGMDRLAQEGLLLSSDNASWVGAERLPFFFVGACAAGLFALPGYQSIAETFVLEEGAGVVGMIAASGQSEHIQAVRLDEALLRVLAARPGPRRASVGEIFRAALADFAKAGGTRYVLDTYNFLGDPQTTVRVP